MASDRQNQQQNQQNRPESSLTRLSKYSAVQFTIHQTLSLYNLVKSSTELTNNLFNKVEKVAFSTVDFLSPLTLKFESQINYVDSIGNGVLDRAETIVPNLLEGQFRAIPYFLNRMLNVKTYATAKLNVVRNFELNKTVSGGLKTVDNLVDEYFPGTDDETNENRNNDDNDYGVTAQLVGIYSKLKKRAVNRLQNIQRLVF